VFRFNGTLHQFGPHPALLLRPCQQPHPPIFVAATFSPVSFEWSGRNGYHLMIVPYLSANERVATLLDLYRKAWVDAGHAPGAEQVHLTYQCYVAEDPAEAWRRGEVFFEDYKAKQLDAVSAWRKYTSDQYPGYELLADIIEAGTFADGVAEQKLLIGGPDQVAAQIEAIRGHHGNVEPSLQVNFGNMPMAEARRTVELFARHVMPRFNGG